MKIKLKEGTYKRYSSGYSSKLKLIDGKIIDIDTDVLFIDQLNTNPIDGVSELGMRIYQIDIKEVIDDERIGRSFCEFCGSYSDTGKECNRCDNGLKYMQEFFPGTKRNPKGVEDEIESLFNALEGGQ